MSKSATIGTVNPSTGKVKLRDGWLHWSTKPRMFEVYKDDDGNYDVAEVDVTSIVQGKDIYGDYTVRNGDYLLFDEDDNPIDIAMCFCNRGNARRHAEDMTRSVVINGKHRVGVGDITYRVLKGQIKEELIIWHNGQLRAINPDAVNKRKVGGRWYFTPKYTRGLGAGVVIKTDESEVLTLGHVSQMYRTYNEARKVAPFDTERSSVRNGRLQGLTLAAHGVKHAGNFDDVIGCVDRVKSWSRAVA